MFMYAKTRPAKFVKNCMEIGNKSDVVEISM